MKQKTPHGTLEVITGPMFSGKTKMLIARLRNAKEKTQLFKPAHDTRYRKDAIVTHDGKRMRATTVRSAKEIARNLLPRTKLVAIDEAQFFGQELAATIREILSTGRNILVSGLSITYNQKPFPPLPDLMTEAEKVTKLAAKCADCGKSAAFHVRITQAISKNMMDKSFIGGAESYKPLCRSCIKK
jgi:thymidine kinase